MDDSYRPSPTTSALIREAHDHLSHHESRSDECDDLIGRLVDALSGTESIACQPTTTKNARIIAVDLDGELAEHYWPNDGPYDPLLLFRSVPIIVIGPCPVRFPVH